MTGETNTTESAGPKIAPGPISFFALLVPIVITGAIAWYLTRHIV